MTHSNDDAEHSAPIGHEATTPLAIPLQGWLAALRRTASQYGHDSIILIAGGVSFFVILSTAPALSAIISIYGLFTDPVGVIEDAAFLRSVLPGAAYELFEQQLVRITDQRTSTLATGLIISLAVAFWMGNSAMRQFCIALTRIHDETLDRPLTAQIGISMLLTLGASLAFLAAAALVGILPAWLKFVWSGPLEMIVGPGRWFILFVISTAYAMVIYHYGPDRRRPRWRWVWPGAAAAGGAWVLSSIVFAAAIQFADNIELLYGPLAGVIIIMLWVFISSIMFLLGAELNAELERQTYQDTTVGKSRPRGERNAIPADEAGKHPDVKSLRLREVRSEIEKDD